MMRFLFLALALLVAETGTACAGEEHFVIMFGSQRVPANPNYSHTFATFVKVTWPGEGACPEQGANLEAHTISWLPAKLVIRTAKLLPEPGANLDVHESIRFAHNTCQRVSLWGPYRTTPDLYCRALRRIAELEGGGIRYLANDMGHQGDRVTNCIHALSTIVEGPRFRVASPGWGEPATFFVLREMERMGDIVSSEPASWIGSALGLDQYPIIYRDYQDRPTRAPRSTAILGPVFRLLGNERDLRATYGPPAP